MFKQTLHLCERNKTNHSLLYKRVLKTLDEDKQNKRDLLLHCFYNQYCNIPIPINDIINESKKNLNKIEAEKQTKEKQSKENLEEVTIDSLFAPSVLQEFYSSNPSKTKTIDFNKASKDKNFKEQLDLIKKGKFSKIEFLMNNKKFTPFRFKEPFNKEDYLREFALISNFQKMLRETSPYIDSSESSETSSTHEQLDEKKNVNELEVEDIGPGKDQTITKTEKIELKLPVYVLHRSSIRAKECLKRYMRKHNIDTKEVSKQIMNRHDNSNNDFYQLKDKDILLWKNSRDKKKLHFSLGKPM